MQRAMAALLVAWIALAGLAQAQDKKPSDPPEEKKPGVFGGPRIRSQQFVRLQPEIQAAFAAKDYALAEEKARACLRIAPTDPGSHYNLACALARQKKIDEALKSLEAAIDAGFTDPAHIRADDDLESLRMRPEFAALLEKAGKPIVRTITAQIPPPAELEPAPIEKGEAIVGEKNTAFDAGVGAFRVYFKFPEPPSDKPIADALGEAGDLLRAWYKEGTAAGNHGDLYNNHDTDHSNMEYGRFPQLTRIEFSEAAKALGVHHGLQAHLFYNGVTLGNSSTALTGGPIWRSQPRLALTNPRHVQMLVAQYYGNHFYIYPEHRDHDPGHNGANGQGHGDVYPCNTPYLLTSQGSSGSDIPHLNAIAATLAAFRPEVKKKLRESGALMPTVQMLYRASSKKAPTPADYRKGAAHPTVFDSADIDLKRLVTMAHDLTADKLPPVVRIRTLEEDRGVVGVDYFDYAERERLLDTPAAIARICKSLKYRRRIVVSADSSSDLNGKPLKFHWVVLRGDQAKIKITPRGDDSATAEIEVAYHERRPIAEGSPLESNRVDIGVFANNGDYDSAPGFVTFYFLDHERRTYGPNERIESVDYTAGKDGRNYVDPLIDLPKNWRDDYRYDEAGMLTGWTRTRGEAKEHFLSSGAVVIDRGNLAILETKKPRYVPKGSPNSTPELVQE